MDLYEISFSILEIILLLCLKNIVFYYLFSPEPCEKPVELTKCGKRPVEHSLHSYWYATGQDKIISFFLQNTNFQFWIFAVQFLWICLNRRKFHTRNLKFANLKNKECLNLQYAKQSQNRSNSREEISARWAVVIETIFLEQLPVDFSTETSGEHRKQGIRVDMILKTISVLAIFCNLKAVSPLIGTTYAGSGNSVVMGGAYPFERWCLCYFSFGLLGPSLLRFLFCSF